MINVKELVGKIIVEIKQNGNDELFFCENDGTKYIMYHAQKCCETVLIEDIIGDLNNLINSPIIMAEKITNRDDCKHVIHSCTWTFYKFATIKGYVTIRWYGYSNGYYSESVDFIVIH